MIKDKTLVLGASPNPSRYSNIAIRLLRENDEPIYAVGRREGEVSGVILQKGMPMFEDVETITLYIGAKNQSEFYDYILALKPRRVIFNPGTENPELMEMLRMEGIQYEAACTLVLLNTGQYHE
jgi:predicted CoA-binding protein